MNWKLYAFTGLSLFVANFCFSQNADDLIDPENFNPELVEELINARLGEYRNSHQLDIMLRHEVLDLAAADQAESNRSQQRINSQDDIGKRLEKYGGTANAKAMAGYLSIKKGKTMFTYTKVAADAMAKFAKSRTSQAVLRTSDYYYSGIGASIDANRGRVYVSLVLGKVTALNTGADKAKRKELTIPYSTKKRGLKPFVERSCKACTKFNSFEKLHEGISIEGKKVYLTYDNLKELKRLLRKSDDGFAVDFVLQEQYPCGADNVYNNNLQSKGYMVKPIYSSKLLSKNEVDEPRPKSFYGPIGKLKKKVLAALPEDYEYNVLIVQGKHLCRTITRSYLEEGGMESLSIFSLYPDTAVNTALAAWEPKAEKNTLEFKVPFEQNKFNYDRDDVEPIMQALNEPKYEVDDIFLEAHSSLEGDSTKNAKLQMRRAESIISVIEDVTNSSALLKEENLTRSFGWDIFQEQIKGNEDYAYFHGKSFSEIKDLLREQEVFNKLEPLLAEQRFAGIRMNITYDISGEYEEPYVVSRLQKAIEKNDGAEALKIQKFAMKKINSGDYDAEAYLNMEVPVESRLASVLVNQLYMKNQIENKGILDESLVPVFKDLFEKAPDNDYVTFNHYLMDVKFDSLSTLMQIKETQSGITKLYSSGITPKFIDALNLEFQFKALEFLQANDDEEEEKETEELIESCLDKIRAIYKIDGSSWQNALKLGYIFITYRDLKYAIEILAPFVSKDISDPELYFTYISAAAHFENQIFSRDFRLAMSKAKELDEERFCSLFGEPYLSFQLLDHPIIKQDYCASCGATPHESTE